jgi:ribose/xylose/arabinose/galactoside ABC-type transport system permease subunit
LNKSLSKVIGFGKQQGLLVAFAVLVLFFSVTSPGLFLTSKNLTLVLRQISIWGVIACGMTLVIVSGHWDLSVGSLTSLTTVVAITLHDKIGPVPAIIIALLVGLLSGTISGYLVGYQKLNSLIITLGMMGVLQAVTLIYTGGKYSRIVEPDETWFSFIGRGFVWQIPFPVIILIVIGIIFTFLLTRTVYGRRVRAVGGNPVASKFTGIRESFVVMSAFMLTGVLTGIGGVMLGSRMMAAQNYIGSGYEFQVITGVILGGTSLTGGEGNISKSIIGIVIIGMLNNWFILMGMQYYYQWAAQWVIILAVVWIDVASKRARAIE